MLPVLSPKNKKYIFHNFAPHCIVKYNLISVIKIKTKTIRLERNSHDQNKMILFENATRLLDLLPDPSTM